MYNLLYSIATLQVKVKDCLLQYILWQNHITADLKFEDTATWKISLPFLLLEEFDINYELYNFFFILVYWFSYLVNFSLLEILITFCSFFKFLAFLNHLRCLREWGPIFFWNQSKWITTAFISNEMMKNVSIFNKYYYRLSAFFLRSEKKFFLTNLRPCQRSSHGFEDQDTIKTVICIKLFYFFYQNLSLELYFCGGKEKEIRSSYFLKTSIGKVL